MWWSLTSPCGTIRKSPKATVYHHLLGASFYLYLWPTHKLQPISSSVSSSIRPSQMMIGVSEVCDGFVALRLHGQAVREQGGPGFLIAFWA